ncbi:HAD-like domain-containing protein [Blastocladiella britannica]|nr:HAD-like domain-containing protein [Blastocladiella britannica]
MHRLSTADDLRAFAADIDTFLLDMDGVLWQGARLIPGVDLALARLRALGKRLIFVTNNSSKSRASYITKFASLGLHGATEDEIFGSAYAAACYLTTLDFPKDKYVYLLGQDGLESELKQQGFLICGGLADKDLKIEAMEHLAETIHPDPKVGAVLTGFDGHLNYAKLAKAHTYLMDPNVLFLSTNADSTFPVGGRTFPGSGSLFQPLIYSTGRHPTVLGKPHATMLDVILKKHHLDPTRTCMVGDRLDTDIAFGINGGTKTLLVLTGVTKEETLLAHDLAIKPHFVVSDLGQFQYL